MSHTTDATMIPSPCGYFEATRSEDALELLQLNKHAFNLAYVIAHRANWRGGFNRHNLEFGEAFLGDYEKLGMTERNYRTAKEVLEKLGFACFKATNKGTIGKLLDTRLFKINPPKGVKPPTASRQPSDSQPTTNLNLKTIKQENSKALSTKGTTKLSSSEKEQADQIESVLGQQWINDGGKWIIRIKMNLKKCERVIAEVVNAHKEGRIKTTPAQYAEQIWKEFS